ncbi:MAG: SpoIIE family protein phosphatase [Ignavibacteriae bacterium]|nr:SpoIIE family protein phosphatase [Ignavibacteriota bacterium]
MRFRRLLYLSGSALSFLVVFIFDVIRKNVELDIGGLTLLRDLLAIGSFVLIYLYLDSRKVYASLTPSKRLGLVMIYAVITLLLSLAVYIVADDNFETKGFALRPITYGQLFLAGFLGIIYGVFAILVFRLVHGLIFFKRKRETERNFLIFVGLVLAAAVSTLTLEPLETSTLTAILVGFSVLFAVINSFRLPWIVYLTKREKIFGLIYGFILFIAFIGLNTMLNVESGVIKRSLLYYSYPLHRFVMLTTIFGNIYFGMAFISTLFHLPTAEAFDRKTSEVTSLHNLSRLVTQVFDFQELVETVTSLTLQVCEAKSCWLELIHEGDEEEHAKLIGEGTLVQNAGLRSYVVQLVARKNIAPDEIAELLSAGEKTLRDEVIENRKPVVIDDVARESRFKKKPKIKSHVGSIVVVPLVSHAGLIGVLYATKEMPYGFFKDDIDVLSAFADQATIAIENSRLIKKSIERERLLREMTLAQEIQRKLLPQSLPRYSTFDIDAVSTPAFEVGGDYYDVAELGGSLVGIVVGDVSGKGVSAAFYMSEVKGIFQSLSRLYTSPREFMIKANEALSRSIDKHSFVSLIYAVVDAESGELTLARAGHCPLLHLSGDAVTYLRPGGMGLGLTDGAAFQSSIEERVIRLQPGDVCVFYTDGVTEARRGDDEFGYDRLLQTVVAAKQRSASELKDEILRTVKLHAEKEENDDDLTVVVVKWLGESRA